jgi:hypothetical protein
MTAVTIACDNWDPLDGYGQVAVALARHLAADHGFDVNAVTGSRPIASIRDPEIRALLERPRRPVAGGIMLGDPTQAASCYGEAVNAGPRVAVTMFESTSLPAGWADALNRHAAVILPSPWLVDVFRSSGVTVPLHVVPLGVNPAYRFIPRPAGRKPFTFLALAVGGFRKGWDAAVRGFDAAFGDDPAYRLLIKLREGRRLNVRVVQPRVDVLARDLDEAGMRALFAAADAFVCASRGEGFGLPPREAAATGLPVIATAWGGTADDIREWGIPLASTLVPAWPNHPHHPRCGAWAEPDVTHLAALMRDVARAPADEATARHRAECVHELYSWSRFTARVREIWLHVAATHSGSVPDTRATDIGHGQPDPATSSLARVVGGGPVGAATSPASVLPLVVIHARADIPWQRRFAAAAAAGLRARGVPFRVTASCERGDFGLPLLLGTTFWRDIEAAGPYLLVDRCSFGAPGTFVSLVRDGHGRRGDHRVPEHPDASRWERHGFAVQPWHPRGDRVVLCGQTETYSPHYRRLAEWYATAAPACTHFRPHPASRPGAQADTRAASLPVAEAWDDCGRVVTLNSSVAVEAVLAGIPTVTMDEAAMAWDVTAHVPEETMTPDRDAWLHWLAWTQWTYDEIREGVPWPRFLD